MKFTLTPLALLAIPLVVSANAIPRADSPGSGSDSQCNTGAIQCCNSVQEANNPVVGILASLLGIGLGSVTGQVGVNCSPIGVGADANSCSAQPACCSGNSFNGALVVGCSPININV